MIESQLMQSANDTRNPKENVVWSTECGFLSEADPSLILTLPMDNYEERDFVQFRNFVSFSRLICKPAPAPPSKEDMRMKQECVTHLVPCVVHSGRSFSCSIIFCSAFLPLPLRHHQGFYQFSSLRL